MQVIVGVDNIHQSLQNPVLTIGNFDGVHRGHQALFEKVKEWAKKLNGQSVVMTFNPHPVEVLFPGKGPRFITSHERKLELIAASGVDAVIVIPFSREFSQISARGFVEDLLVGKIGVKALIVGHDYRFGHKREGDIDLLKQLGREFGFEVDTLDGIRVGDKLVSSTIIRQLIQKGQVVEANTLLGRPFEVIGPVVSGRKRGASLLGFPTANLRLPLQVSPSSGVYVVEVEMGGTRYAGAANIGTSPTFNNGEMSLEVHILDFSRDIYGDTIIVRFLDRLRDEKKFSGPAELTEQIRKDVVKTREFFASAR